MFHYFHANELSLRSIRVIYYDFRWSRTDRSSIYSDRAICTQKRLILKVGCNKELGRAGRAAVALKKNPNRRAKTPKQHDSFLY